MVPSSLCVHTSYAAHHTAARPHSHLSCQCALSTHWNLPPYSGLLWLLLVLMLLLMVQELLSQLLQLRLLVLELVFQRGVLGRGTHNAAALPLQGCQLLLRQMIQLSHLQRRASIGTGANIHQRANLRSSVIAVVFCPVRYAELHTSACPLSQWSHRLAAK